MGKVSGDLISEIKLGKLIETARVWQDYGMTAEDFRSIRKNHSLALEVFRTVRDYMIFKNVRYSREYKRDEQMEKFTEWNEKLNLNIPNTDFINITEKFPYPPACSLKGLYCTCLVYEFGDPLETLLKGIRILDYELHKIRGRVEFDQSLGGIYNHEKLELSFPEKIPPEKVRFRPEALIRKKGFRFITVELGRALPIHNLLSDKKGEEEKGCHIISKFLKERDQKKVKNLGQELPYIAAMYPGWTTSFCRDNDLYYRPLALDIQVDSIYKEFYPEHTSALCLTENLNSDYPTYGKNQSFKIRAKDLMYGYIEEFGSGYGICTIVEET